MDNALKTILGAFGLFSIICFGTAKAQCNLNIIPDTVSIVCGDSLTLEAIAIGNVPLLTTDFNSGTAGPGWSSGGGTTYGTPCGQNPTGTPYYWASTTAGTPQLTTVGFDVSCGGSISFDMAYATQGGAVPCEGPDLPDEGVTFQYSIDGGLTWVTIQYWDPNGGYDPILTTWNTYSFTIPAAAIGPSTMFRWIQLNSSGTCCDNWGLDNIIIDPGLCGTYWYDWAHVPGSPDSTIQIVAPISTTQYSVLCTDGVDICYDTVNVVVDPLVANATTTNDSIFCGNCVDLNVSLSNGLTIPYDYIWTPSTDLSNPLIQNPQACPMAPILYSAQVIDPVSGCSAIDDVFIDVTCYCVFDSLSGVVSQCENGNTFTISGVFSYILNPGTGTIIVEATNSSGTVTEIINGPFTDFTLTNYTVSGIISDGSPVTLSVYFSDDLSCISSFADVSPVLPTVTTVTGGGIYCIGDPIANIYADVTGNGPWTVDYTIDGVPQSAAGASNPVDLGNAVGEYIITSVSDVGCSNVASGTQLIETIVLPEVVSLSGGATYCFGDSLNDIIVDVSGTSPWVLDFTMNGVSMTINSSSSQINIGNTPGNYSVVAITDSTCSNSATGAQSIIVQPLPIVFAGDDFVSCDGDEIVLSGNGAQTYTWDNGITNGVGFIPTATLTYTVTGTDTNGCINTDAILVTFELLPDVSFIADSTIGCEPWEVLFTNTTTGNIQNCVWDFGDGNGNDLCGPVTNTYENGGLYDVTLTTTSVNGCTNSATYDDFIYVEDNPVASFTASASTVLSLNTQVFFTNTSEGAVNYLWSFGDSLAYSTDVHPTYFFPDNVTQAYEVVLIAISPIGCRDTISKLIQVNQEIIFYIPNSFTPDGDEFNQTFQPIFTAGFDPFDFQMFIYNRWGEIVFETNDSERGWDGTYNGNIVQEGAYNWKIEFKTELNDERMMHTGHLNVLK